MIRYDLIVVGSGPAGLFAAGLCAEDGLNVLLIEKNSRLGLKLLASGSGQCNITNKIDHDEFIKQFGGKERFVRNAINTFGSKELINFFESRDIEFEITGQGKVFPKSRKAMEILDVLKTFLKQSGVKVLTNERVEVIEKKNDFYKVKTSNDVYLGKSVLIATGGKSYPNLGTTGDGYEFAKNLGHEIKHVTPSLTPIYNNSFELVQLSGVSFKDIDISVYRNQKKIGDYRGDLLFTHKGLSGPVILNNSREFEVGDKIFINFVKFRNEEDFRKGFEDNLIRNNKYTIKRVLDLYDVPKRLIETFLMISKTDPSTKCAELPKENRKKLIKYLCAFPFEIKEMGDYNIAMATNGGVSTKEINSKTYESRLSENLYFAGEVIDVDGNTGGFNIQFAFSSAYAVAQSIIEKN